MTAVDPGLAVSGAARTRPRLAVVRDYVSLTKPRIIELLLVTTVPTMILAQGGLPSGWLVVATLVGGTLAAASANTLNCVYDRDIDQVMHRTRNRPLATGALSVRSATVFGITLGALSLGWLSLVVNVLSAVLALLAIALYVVFYTMLLKRRTPQNIVWGGVAGCMPVLVGWAAVTGSLSWTPWVLFAVIFFWTPPHYWPLSLRFLSDYASAGVPMLPVVASTKVVARQIVAYSWAMVAVTLLLWPVAAMSWFYGATVVLTGAWFLLEAHALQRRVASGAADVRAMRLFHGSITYLTVVFLAVAIDPLLPF